MGVVTRLMTADEFLTARFPPGTRHELIRGEIRELDMPGELHGDVTMEVGFLVKGHVKHHRLGRVYAAETHFVTERNPDTARAPDVSFVRNERLAEIVDRSKFVPFVPDLAIEVASPTDRPKEIAEKTNYWLATGVLMVWNLYPLTMIATVHRPGQPTRTLSADDVIDGEEVLPGFLCRVGDFFLST